jgi:hypothetical protein
MGGIVGDCTESTYDSRAGGFNGSDRLTLQRRGLKASP